MIALASGVAAPAAEAQTGQTGRSTLRGAILSARTGRGLQAAEVLLLAQDERPVARAVTDSAGRFVLDSLEEGPYRVRVRHVGRSTRDHEIRLRRTEVKRIDLRVTMPALTVEDLEVTVEAAAASHRLEGFTRRRERGHGFFIGPEELREMQPRFASDVLRNVPGLMIGPDGYGDVSVFGTRSSRRCRPVVWLNGQELEGYRIDNLEPDDLLAVEVFRGESEIPARFRRRQGQCAAIIVWTREGRRRMDRGRDGRGVRDTDRPGA